MKIALQNKMNDFIIRDDLIKIALNFQDKVEIISLLSDLLFKFGYVTDGFCKAVLEREKIYPTGLPFPIGVAIPHTDAIHVKESAIAVGVLSDSIRFGEMGSQDKEVDVRIVCILAIDKPELIISVLRILIKKFQDISFLYEILNASTPKLLSNILNENLKSI